MQSTKKMLMFDILDILRKYSDEEHRLSQKDVETLLKTEHGVSAERKTIKRNLTCLIDAGFPIEFTERVRKFKNSETGAYEETVLLTEFYYVHEFTNAQLRLLIDSVAFSNYISSSQSLELVGKLEKLSNRYFRSRVQYVNDLPADSSQNKQLFLTIETLDEAIYSNKQVEFTYNEYHTDKQMHPRVNTQGEVRRYVINPYYIAASNGKYYLICNYDKYDGISNYRIDRITDIKLLETPIKPAEKADEFKHTLNLARHMSEHIYMYTGSSATVCFRMKKKLLNEIMDWFGSDIEFFDETAEHVSARVFVNLQAMRKWAMQYAVDVEILSPESLRKEIEQDVCAAAQNYSLKQ